MAEISIGVYHSRALQLANAMELCHDGMSAYASAVAILAVHSAISYNDAVLLKLTGQRSRGEDHKQAVTAITKVCRKAKIETNGLRHLNKLIAVKTDVSYSDQEVSNEKAEILYETARRFQVWAERLLKTEWGRL
jgi:hypothetical protein